jgi:hypothetical protein
MLGYVLAGGDMPVEVGIIKRQKKIDQRQDEEKEDLVDPGCGTQKPAADIAWWTRHPLSSVAVMVRIA